MAEQIISIHDKTISKKFPDWKQFWQQSQTALLSIVGATADTKDRVNAYFFTWKVYDYWKYNIYWGYSDQFYNKLFTRISTAFLELQKRENLYNQLFKKIKLQADKLVNIKTIETTTPSKEVTKGLKKGLLADRRWDSESKDLAQVKAINRNKPISAIDLIAGEYGIENRADWLETEMETAYGIKSREGEKIKFNPNWATGKGHYHDRTNLTDDQVKAYGTGKKVLNTQQQPLYTQQIANIIRSFGLSESSITEYVVDYFGDLFYNNTIYMPPGADLKWNSQNQTFSYKEREAKEETAAEQEQIKLSKPKTEFERLSQEQYDTLKEGGEAVEDTLDLENLCRERAKNKKYPLRDVTKQASRMKAFDTLIMAYNKGVYWPTLDNYDKIMSQITGFKEFKTELRNRTEISEYYRSIRRKMPQVFYCLLGKPGVGKSEISKTLAKAYKRPFNVLGMAGQAHPKILKGMRPTLDGAKYGRIIESFVDSRANIFLTKTDHEKELIRLNAKPKKTKNQEDYIRWLETEIKEIEKQERKETSLQNELNAITGTDLEATIKKEKIADRINNLKGKAYDLPSKAPIILLDESEKVKDETVLYIMGQITDRELNYWYEDEFLEYGINLGEAIVLLTANYSEKVPDFVRSRCKFVNIQLLSFRERLNILQIRRDMLIREYFPAKRYDWENVDATNSEIDKYNQRHSKIAPLTDTSDYNNSTILLTDEQQQIKELMDDNFLNLCITETFGIREGIINLIATIDFLVLAKTRKVIDQLPKLGSITSTDKKDNNYREEITNEDGGGLINLYFDAIRDGNGDRQPLSITKKREVEFKKDKKEDKGKAESVLNLVKDWPTYNINWQPTKTT